MPGNDPTSRRDPSDVELAVQAERALWENAIIYAARRAGVEYRQLSAGQVVDDMANEILRLRAKLEQAGD